MKHTKLAYIFIVFLFSCSDSIPDSTLGADRPAKVFLPSGYDSTKSYPLVTLLHGYSATGGFQNSYFGLSEKVDDHQFILILPEGTTDTFGQQFWNATDGCCDFNGANPDDKSYLMSLVDEAIGKYSIDEKNIAFMGHSNGEFMSHSMACEYGQNFCYRKFVRYDLFGRRKM